MNEEVQIIWFSTSETVKNRIFLWTIVLNVQKNYGSDYRKVNVHSLFVIHADW